MKKRPAILFTSPIMEHPAAGGPELRIENSIKALSRICELDVISGSPLSVGDAGKDAREFYLRYCHEFSILPSLTHPISSNWYLRILQQMARQLPQPNAANHASIANRVNQWMVKHLLFNIPLVRAD